jgi:uncharacterized protein (UPF0332 family)
LLSKKKKKHKRQPFLDLLTRQLEEEGVEDDERSEIKDRIFNIKHNIAYDEDGNQIHHVY